MCNVESVSRVSTVLLIPMYKCKHIQHRLHNGSSLLGARKVKCAIKFVRALITSFLITSLIRKVDKNMNILGIANANR